MLAIDIKNLSFTYPEAENSIIKNLSLQIEEGEFIALVGENGSGKSTLARIIDGLLLPSAGEVLVFGKSVKEKENLFFIRSSCGIVFQNPDNQTVASIVEDDVAFGPENIGIEREEIGKRIEFALNATNTESFRKSAAANLSGGQKQRVAIAGVLAVKPKILILDESTSMLDPKGRNEVMQVVKKLNKEENMTVIIITHYMEETVECDKIVVLDQGNVLIKGTPNEVFSSEELLKAAGLDIPISLKISRMLKEGGIDVGDNLTKEMLKEKLCKYLQKT